MRTWLFFKEVSLAGEKGVEFRRVERSGLLTTILPDELRTASIVPAGTTVEKHAAKLVLRSGWVGQPAIPANSEVGKAVLRGRW